MNATMPESPIEPARLLPRILCVDDEPNVLTAMERTLFEQFDVLTAPGGRAGLNLIRSQGPFAVVVSDMRMPEMDGAAFLAQAREIAPDTVRILLTGQADTDAAIAAVNKGNIFRFLCKPCPQDLLVCSLDAAVEQYRLVTAERELLENTLKGAVKVLTEVLSLASPIAFSRSDQIKAYVAHMAQRLELEDRWKYEMAAMLSQLGCITLPSETLDKVYAGQDVPENERQIFDEHPEVGYKLLAHIPRLGPVAAMIRGQRSLAHEDGGSRDDDADERLGAEMLRTALAADQQVGAGATIQVAVAKLEKAGGYDERLLDALKSFKGNEQTMVKKALAIAQLQSAMILDEDVYAKNGTIVIGKGEKLHAAHIERLRNFSRGIGLVEPVRVWMPASHYH